MMKRMLVLVLVLGMASMASAALTVADNGVTWSVVGSQLVGAGVSGAFYGTIEATAGGTITPAATGSVNGAGAYDAAGDLGGVEDFAPAWLIEAGDVSNATQPNQSAADWFVFDIVLDQSSTSLSIDLMNVNDGWTGVVSNTFTGIPEPMTVVLLGLGGLFLRRKK